MSKNFNGFHLKREYLIKLVLEIFSVIFAVILALLVNEWRQNKANQRIANNAMKNVVKEIYDNRAKVDSVLVKHKEMLPILDSLKQAIIKRADDDTSSISFGNISLEVLSNTAWTTIKSTEVINFMDFSKIMEISELYEVQSFYMQIVNEFMNDPEILEMYTISEDEGMAQMKRRLIKIIKGLQVYMSRLVDLGNQLSQSYKSTLEEIGQSKPEN